MILHYLWVENHPVLGTRGFNVGGKFRFEYDQENRVLDADNLETLPFGFFNPEAEKPRAEIVNVTCVVGANGSGKSSLLDLLRDCLPLGMGGEPSFPCVIVFEQRNHHQKFAPGFYHGTTLKNSIHLGSRKEIFSDESNQFRETDSYRDWWKQNLQVVFYTNIFDFSLTNEVFGLNNLSTNYLLRNDGQSLRNVHISKIVDAERSFQIREYKRFIDFLNSEFAELLPFKPPKTLTAQVSNFNIGFVESMLEGADSKNYSSIRKLIADAQEDFKKATSAGFLSYLSISAFCSYVRDWQLRLEDVERSISSIIVPATNVTDRVRTAFTNLGAAKLPSSPGTGKQILAFLNDVEEYVSKINEYDWSRFYGLLPLPFIGKAKEGTVNLLNLYDDSVGITEYLEFNWSRMSIDNEDDNQQQARFSMPVNTRISSGEQSLLTMYSRFHSLVTKGDNDKWVDKDVLILIDEGTEYFHPEWQRHFLKYVLDFFPYVFDDTVKLQIIMATNSPIAISDLPRQNLIVMEDSSGNDLGQTFGANIHTLLSQTMFLDSTIGAFAEDKIQQVIDMLYKKDSTRIIDRATAQKIIHLVAEPIIRGELQRKLDQGRIQELEEELRKRDAIEGERGNGDA